MHQVVSANLTIGSFVAFNTYVSLYEQGFSSLANIYLNLSETLISIGRFLQLLERQADIPFGTGARPTECNGALELRDVSFAYPSERTRPVLSHVSLVARPGETVALVGESGAGKSTIGRLIERFYDPLYGSLLLDGVDFRSLDLRWLRSRIGLVEQEPVLFDLSVRANISYAVPTASPAEIERAAKLAHAHAFIEALPGGYESRPGERGVRLSGGQKQRVAIARAIVKDPRLLLLDEATSALDSESEATVQQALDGLMESKTTIVIAHRLSTVVGASTIVVLDRGAIVESGTHSELASRPGSRYAQFMRHQLVSK